MMRKLKFNIIGLVGLSFLTASLVVAVGVTNNPVQKFIVDSWAKGGRVQTCEDRGSASVRNSCKEGRREREDKLAQKAAWEAAHAVIVPNKLEFAETSFLSKIGNGKTVEPVIKKPTVSVINEKEKIAERDKLEAQRLANEAKDIAAAEAEKQRLDEIRDRDEKAAVAAAKERAEEAKQKAEAIARAQRIIVAAEAKERAEQKAEAARAQAEKTRLTQVSAGDAGIAKCGSDQYEWTGSGCILKTAQAEQEKIEARQTAVLEKALNLAAHISPAVAIVNKIVEANTNVNAYTGCETQLCNSTKTFFDDFIPDSYTNYWQGQVAKAKPEDNLLDIAYNKGTTFDTMQAAYIRT